MKDKKVIHQCNKAWTIIRFKEEMQDAEIKFLKQNKKENIFCCVLVVNGYDIKDAMPLEMRTIITVICIFIVITS